jgi:large subunit ribosomal protein L23
MALFDFLKRKEEVEKAKKPRKAEKKARPAKSAERVSLQKPEAGALKQESVSVAKPSVRSKKVSGFSHEAVKQPHISEKATYLAEKNQYTFEVLSSYNKQEIKKSVEGIYGVDVLSVNKIKIPAKKRMMGGRRGFKKGYIKAVVKIKEGQKIEIL